MNVSCAALRTVVARVLLPCAMRLRRAARRARRAGRGGRAAAGMAFAAVLGLAVAAGGALAQPTGPRAETSAGQRPHQHGVATLDVAVEGSGQVTMDLEVPLDSVVGFERAPRSEGERRAAATALASLRDGGRLFGFPSEARCTLRGVDVAAAVLEAPGKPPQGGTPAPDGGHADLDATYRYACERPAALAAIEVRLFDALPRLRRLDVQVAMAGGQHRRTLNPQARWLRLGR